MKTTPTCKICRRKLENAKSIANGVGPECAQKFAAMLIDAGLTLEALNISTEISTDNAVRRNLHYARQAMLAGDRRVMERFKLAAKEAAQRAERAQWEATSWEEERRVFHGWPIQAAEGAAA
jgi:hypothetical protein